MLCFGSELNLTKARHIALLTVVLCLCISYNSHSLRKFFIWLKICSRFQNRVYTSESSEEQQYLYAKQVQSSFLFTGHFCLLDLDFCLLVTVTPSPLKKFHSPALLLTDRKQNSSCKNFPRCRFSQLYYKAGQIGLR